MTNSQQIYFQAEASLQKIRNYILDVIGFLIIIYCIFKFYENPILISIIILFLVFMILISGYNKVTVYNDRIEFKVQHTINKLSKLWLLQFKEIQSIDANLQLTKRGFLLSEILSDYLPVSPIWNTLTITLKNGEKKVINTKVYKKDIIRALEILKKLTKGEIIISN